MYVILPCDSPGVRVALEARGTATPEGIVTEVVKGIVLLKGTVLVNGIVLFFIGCDIFNGSENKKIYFSGISKFLEDSINPFALDKTVVCGMGMLNLSLCI